MTTTTSVFLPDEQEQQITKKPSQSVRPTAHGSDATDSADPYAEIQKLNEHELKAAIKSAWKKHEESARADLAPLLYYLREQLRAQGARNDLGIEKDRGFAAWVEENLDISRRTADRWCEWFAVAAGLKPSTSGHVTKSDVALWDEIQNEHEGQQQIAFNCWVPKAVHGQFTKALTTLQRRLNLKNKKEAMVKGVIYAATAINREAKSGRSSSMVGRVSLRKHNTKRKGYLDMFHDRIKKAEATWPEEDFGLFWDARKTYLPVHLLLEDNPYEVGAKPKKTRQNHYRLTGQVIAMDCDWPCFRNDYRQDKSAKTAAAQ